MPCSKKILERLPWIIASGRREAKRILDERHPVTLETREWVLPAKDSAILNWIRASKRRERSHAQTDMQSNRLVHGNDLQVMAALLAEEMVMPSLQGRIDLIYMDTRFWFNGNFQAKEVWADAQGKCQPAAQFATSNQEAFGITPHLAALTPRLFLMRELLSHHGLICMRVKAHAKYYLKMVIEAAFDTQELHNHILCEYPKDDSTAGIGTCEKFRDVFLLFAKGKRDHLWLESLCTCIQKCGTPCNQKDGVTNSDENVNLGSISSIEILLERSDQEISAAGQELQWGDISNTDESRRNCHCASLGRVSLPEKENSRYVDEWSDTLLEAIILTSTDPDSIVADFSGAAGNTAATAERLGRRWITSDAGKSACTVIRERLIDQDAEPFLYQAVGKSSENAAKTFSGVSSCTGDLAQVVLLLYGALPLQSEYDPNRNLGQVLEADGKTLVRVESPNEPIGLAALRKAIRQRDSLMGGWDRIVVLGWRFAPSIRTAIATLNDSGLEVLAIPADLLDILQQNGDAGSIKGQACFKNMYS
jgi:adenine-specific DNA-methyltransferase